MGDSVLQSDLWTNHLSSSVLSIASSVARLGMQSLDPDHLFTATAQQPFPTPLRRVLHKLLCGGTIKSLMRMLRGGKKASCRFMEM